MNEQEWKDALRSLSKHPFKWAIGHVNAKDLKSLEANDRLLNAAVQGLKTLFVASAGARSITRLPALTGSTFEFEDRDGTVAASNGEVTFIATAPTLITMRVVACNGHTWPDWMRVAKDVAEYLDTDVILE
jgi:hypothetical protein